MKDKVFCFVCVCVCVCGCVCGWVCVWVCVCVYKISNGTDQSDLYFVVFSQENSQLFTIRGDGTVRTNMPIIYKEGQAYNMTIVATFVRYF